MRISCNRCGKDIEMERTAKGWKAFDLTGKNHNATCSRVYEVEMTPEQKIRKLDKKLMRGDFDEELGIDAWRY